MKAKQTWTIPQNTLSLRDIESALTCNWSSDISTVNSHGVDVQTIVTHDLWALHVCQWVIHSKKYLISFQMEFIHIHSGSKMMLFSSITADLSLIDWYKTHCMEYSCVLKTLGARKGGTVHVPPSYHQSVDGIWFYLQHKKKGSPMPTAETIQRQRSQEDWCCVQLIT